MDKNAAKRWRPVIRAIVENQLLDEAVDSILLLLEAPGQKIVVVQPSAAAEPPRRLRAVPGGRDDDADPANPPATDADEKAPLDPLAFFSVEEGAIYLGIGRERMYQLLKAEPEKLPHKKEIGPRGREEYRLSGRGLNAFRWEREKAKASPE